jgi:hypothetical protein
MKEQLIEAQKSYIIEKYGEQIGFSTEYDYSSAENTITSRIGDAYGKLIGYITSWSENNEIKHHVY